MTDEITDAQAIRHFKRHGVILPGHAGTIADYVAEEGEP